MNVTVNGKSMELPDGRQVRDFPRLKYGGAHLKDPAADWAPDVARRCLYGFAAGTLVWLTIVTLICALLARRDGVSTDFIWRAVWRGETEMPWRAVLVTLAVMLAIGAPAIALSAKYYVLGTDKVGQDVFYQSLKSIRIGLVIGTVTTLVMLPFRSGLGLLPVSILLHNEP